MSDLLGATLGSDISIPHDFSSRVRVCKVTSITEKQIICGNKRIRKSDGLVIGSGSNAFTRTFAHITTPSELLQDRIYKASERLSRLVVTKENLESVEALFDN